MADNSKRAHKHEAAIVALLAHPTLDEAAAAVGIATRTLKRWLEDPAFKRAYLAARRHVYSHAVAHAQQALTQGIHVLVTIMQDQQAPASARVAAVGKLEDMARRGMEIEDLAERLAALESRILGTAVP